MTALAPGTARSAFNATLLQMEAASLRVDEDLIGVPMPEPLDGGPGLLVSVFPLVQGRPGEPGVVYPARALARVPLTAGLAVQFVRPAPLPPGMTAERALGSPARPQAPPPPEDQARRARYMALLDEAAPLIARPRGAEMALRAEVRALWGGLVVPTLVPSCRLFAPHFHAWLDL